MLRSSFADPAAGSPAPSTIPTNPHRPLARTRSLDGGGLPPSLRARPPSLVDTAAEPSPESGVRAVSPRPRAPAPEPAAPDVFAAGALATIRMLAHDNAVLQDQLGHAQRSLELSNAIVSDIDLRATRFRQIAAELWQIVDQATKDARDLRGRHWWDTQHLASLVRQSQRDLRANTDRTFAALRQLGEQVAINDRHSEVRLMQAGTILSLELALQSARERLATLRERPAVQDTIGDAHSEARLQGLGTIMSLRLDLHAAREQLAGLRARLRAGEDAEALREHDRLERSEAQDAQVEALGTKLARAESDLDTAKALARRLTRSVQDKEDQCDDLAVWAHYLIEQATQLGEHFVEMTSDSADAAARSDRLFAAREPALNALAEAVLGSMPASRREAMEARLEGAAAILERRRTPASS